MNRRPLLFAAFGLPIAGALAASYLHLAAWLAPWMPPGFERLAWLAALALDGLILAPIVARQIVGAAVPGRSLTLAQWAGIGASVYVNARWGAETMKPAGAWDWTDVIVGAAILPLLALVGEHAMRATLAAVQAQEAAAQEAAAPEPPRRTRRQAPGRAPSTAPESPEAALDQTAPNEPRPIQAPRQRPGRPSLAPPWSELARHGDTTAAIAANTGWSLRTVQRRQKEAGA